MKHCEKNSTNLFFETQWKRFIIFPVLLGILVSIEPHQTIDSNL